MQIDTKYVQSVQNRAHLSDIQVTTAVFWWLWCFQIISCSCGLTLNLFRMMRGFHISWKFITNTQNDVMYTFTCYAAQLNKILWIHLNFLFSNRWKYFQIISYCSTMNWWYMAYVVPSRCLISEWRRYQAASFLFSTLRPEEFWHFADYIFKYI